MHINQGHPVRFWLSTFFAIFCSFFWQFITDFSLKTIHAFVLYVLFSYLTKVSSCQLHGWLQTAVFSGHRLKNSFILNIFLVFLCGIKTVFVWVNFYNCKGFFKKVFWKVFAFFFGFILTFLLDVHWSSVTERCSVFGLSHLKTSLFELSVKALFKIFCI